MKTETLFELQKTYNSILDTVEAVELEDVLTDDKFEELFQMKSSTECQIKEKILNYSRLIKFLENNLDILKAEIDRLNKKKQSLNNSIIFLRDAVIQVMNRMDYSKIENPLIKVSLAKCPPSVKIVDERIISDSFKEIEIISKVNKSLILESLKAGDNVDGVELCVNTSLRIK